MIPPLGGSSQQNSLDELGHTPHALLMECRYFVELQFSADHIRDIEALGKMLKDNPEHADLIAQGQRAIKVSDASKLATLLSDGLATFGSVHPLLAIKSWYEVTTSVYQSKGISEQIRIATLLDIKLWMESYSQSHGGKTGLEQVFWISRHLCANILRMGRLQYETKPFNQPVNIYRDKRTETLIVLAEKSLACSELGHLASETPIAFTTSWFEDEHIITAHPVDTTSACIHTESSTFVKADMHLVCERETEVVFIHIPSNEPLHPQAVEDSLLQAKAHFPSQTVFVCISWLLDPALSLVASQASNIVSFMQRFAKFPVPFQNAQIFERVFGQGMSKSEILHMQGRTSLQANIQRELRNGTVFRTIGGIL